MEPANHPKRHVLVVDDDPVTLKTINSLVTRAGFTATTANTPRDAIFALYETRPNVILLDMHFPDCRGGAIANEIRADKANDSVAIVAMSGYTDEFTRDSVLRAGCDDFLAKPFTPDNLIRILTTVIETRSAAQK